MKKVLVALGVSAALGAGITACRGGGDSPSEPSPVTGAAFSPTPAVAGQPSELDLARLASRFGAIGGQVLQQTLPASGSSASFSLDQVGVEAPLAAGLRTFGVQSNSSTVGAFFLCCSDTASTNLLVTGSVGGGTPGAVPVSLSYSTGAPLQWTGVSGGATWDLTFQTGTLTLTGTVTATNGSIGPNQRLTLSGSLQYTVPGASNNFFLPVSLTFTYADLNVPVVTDAGNSVPPTASGNVGSLQIQSTALPSVTMTGRCSAPQEGCGPLVSGPCPCTKWPPCPSYGLSCPGTFK